MELKDQVPILELSKRLEKLGYPQEGLFWWQEGNRFNEDRLVDYKVVPDLALGETGINGQFVAPTVAEMEDFKDKNMTVGILVPIMREPKESYTNFKGRELVWLIENDYLDFKGKK